MSGKFKGAVTASLRSRIDRDRRVNFKCEAR